MSLTLQVSDLQVILVVDIMLILALLYGQFKD